MSENTGNPDQISARIDALAFGGACIGVITSPPEISGKKALVREVVPGEEVEARVVKAHKQIVEAELRRVVQPSPDRIPAPCPCFGRCGGCDLQHIALPRQRALKLSMVETMLKFQAGLAPAEGFTLLGGDLPGYAYRVRVGLHLARDGRIGFYKPKSGDVVDIERCLLASDVVNQALAEVRRYAKQLAPFVGKISIEELGAEIALVLEMREDSGQKAPDLLESMGGLKQKFPHVKVLYGRSLVYMQEGFREKQRHAPDMPPFGHFSQVNAEGNKLLVSTVVSHAEGEAVTDLYAGDGNFALPLAAAGKKVEAVEVDALLVNYGRQLAAARGLEQISFFQSSCERFMGRHNLLPTVVLDPPRSGAKDIVAGIHTGSVRQVIYVSCNLPSLARDLKTLTGSGFKLRRVYVVDMFSQTHHVETVSILSV